MRLYLLPQAPTPAAPNPGRLKRGAYEPVRGPRFAQSALKAINCFEVERRVDDSLILLLFPRPLHRLKGLDDLLGSVFQPVLGEDGTEGFARDHPVDELA